MGVVLLDFNEYVALVRLICDGCGALVCEKIVAADECAETNKKTVLCCKCKDCARTLYGADAKQLCN